MIPKDLFPNLAFMAFAGMTVVSALLVVVFRNLLHAAVALFFCLGGVAGLYVLLGADFLGVTQLLIYAGGILILIIFGVFMTSRIYGVDVDLRGKRLSHLWGGAVALALFAVMAMVITRTEWPTKEPVFHPTTAKLGDLFLTKYLLPFELISLLLLFAMIGSVLLVRKEVEDR